MFQQSAVEGLRQGDELLDSSVIAATMKFLANSSVGYQILDRSPQTVTRYLSDEKTFAAINNNIFKRLDFKIEQLYEVELAKSAFNHKEPFLSEFLFCSMQC